MKVRPNFDIREFVPPSVWRQFGRKSRWFLDGRMLDLAQFYRDFFSSPVRINTWFVDWLDHDFTMRGFRPPGTDVGSSYSQHRFGRAFDCNIEGMTPDEVRAEIQANEDLFMGKGLTTLEDGSIADTWVHSDIRKTETDHILIVGA